MIAKSYKLNDTEILMMKYNSKYSVIRLVKGENANIIRSLSYEDAGDVWDFWLDMELGVVG